MNVRRSIALVGVATACAAALTGCSVVDTVLWGHDGAQVIQATENLIQDLAADGTSDLLCEDFDADLGSAADWAGRSVGEPERFFADYWEDQVPLDPQWTINVEGLPEGAVPGDTFPGDVFYRETDLGLCVIDVVWPTLVSVG
jgi:hypothetical protein